MKSYLPLPEANYGRRPTIHNFLWRIALGLWGHPESEQSHWKQFTQEQSVSLIHLESLFKSLVSSFHHLRALGLYAVCSFHLMFEVLLTCCTKSTTKAGPLPDPMLVGNSNLRTIYLSRHWATSDVLSVQVEKAFTHLGNVHTMTSR